MGVGKVADVMEEGGGIPVNAAGGSYPLVRTPQLQPLQYAAGNLVDSQGMARPGVDGTGIHQLGRTQLADPAEPHKVWCGEGRRQFLRQVDVLPQGVTDCPTLHPTVRLPGYRLPVHRP